MTHARAGSPVRRAAWQNDPATYGAKVVFVKGAGTTRAVAVRQLGGAETVVTAATVTAADMQADDWVRTDLNTGYI